MARVSNQDYINSLRTLNKECTRLGLPYATFVENAQVLLHIKRKKPEFQTEAMSFLRSIERYATARCRVLNLKTLNELYEQDDKFLGKAFMFHVTNGKDVDRNIAQFVSYCNIHLDMFDTDDLQKLQKDIVKRMKLNAKPDDKNYWPSLLRALPDYMKGDYPAKKPSKLKGWFDKLKLPDFKKMIPLDKQYDILNKKLYPEAKLAYGFRDGLSVEEKELAALAVMDTRAIMKQKADYDRFRLFEADGIFCIVLTDGLIVWEGQGDSMWQALLAMDNPSKFINDQRKLVFGEDHLEVAGEVELETVSAAELERAGASDELQLVLGWYCKGNKLYDDTDKEVCKFSSPNEIPAAMSNVTKLKELYGTFLRVDTGCALTESANENYLVLDEEGTIVYIGTTMSEATEVMKKVVEGSLTDDYKLEELERQYKTKLTQNVISSFVAECCTTYVHPNLPIDSVGLLFSVTPLLKSYKNKI